MNLRPKTESRKDTDMTNTTENYELVWKIGATCFAIAITLALAWGAYPLAQLITRHRDK
jgi:hypothetical protein